MCEDKLCDMCVKFHRRFNFTKDHKLFLLEELKKTPIVTEAVRSCLAHSEENIKYYCEYHSLPCCATCVCTAHKECNDIKNVSEIAEELRTKDFNNFCCEIGDLETELTVIIVNVVKNISDIEEKSVRNVPKCCMQKFFNILKSRKLNVSTNCQRRAKNACKV